MQISKEYQSAIRQRLVKEFIKTNQRAPTAVELQQSLLEKEKYYASIDEVGFSGFILKRPGFSASSSAQQETENFQAMIDDQEVLRVRLENLSLALESSFRSFVGAIANSHRTLSQLEKRIDSLLLMNGNSDVFLNSIEESFNTHEFVDYDSTTALVQDGYVTIGKSGYSLVDLSTAKIKYSVIAPQGVLAKRVSTAIETLTQDDGKFWEYILFTDYEEGRISVVVEIEFTSPTYISDLRLGLAPSSVTKKMTGNFFVSTDGKVFVPVGEPETPLENSSFELNIGLADVKKLQLILSKDAFDAKNSDGRQNIYSFAMDSIKIYSDPYKELVSTLICGPYTVTDSSNQDVFFTKAKLSACTYEPSGTSIDFFLSNDGTIWSHCAHDQTASNIVLFGTTDMTGTIGYIDALDSIGTLVESLPEVDALDFTTEALLNGYILAASADKIPTQSIVVKRNINTDFDRSLILGAERGWKIDPLSKRYVTTVYVDALEGKQIDFGPKSLIVNGREVSGVVLLNQGYSVIQISDINYGVVAAGLTTTAELKAVDPLYPYNHKLLVSGYDYPGNFSGDKIYTGVDEYFSSLMKYVAPDYFTFLEVSDPDFYNVFTIEEVDGTLYFKIKVNKTDASWSQELCDITWTYQSTDSNHLWVKAILSSDSLQNTPKLESFSVKVI